MVITHSVGENHSGREAKLLPNLPDTMIDHNEDIRAIGLISALQYLVGSYQTIFLGCKCIKIWL